MAAMPDGGCQRMILMNERTRLAARRFRQTPSPALLSRWPPPFVFPSIVSIVSGEIWSFTIRPMWEKLKITRSPAFASVLGFRTVSPFSFAQRSKSNAPAVCGRHFSPSLSLRNERMPYW